jgi:hypothetical protein
MSAALDACGLCWGVTWRRRRRLRGRGSAGARRGSCGGHRGEGRSGREGRRMMMTRTMRQVSLEGVRR